MCENCDQKILDSLHDIALLDKAQKILSGRAEDNGGDIPLPEHLRIHIYSTVRENQPAMLLRLMLTGEDSGEVITRFATIMMEMGFAEGVSVAHKYREHYPEIFITEEERAAFIENQRAIQESLRRENQEEGEVEKPEPPVAPVDEEPRPGMYL